EGQPLSPQVIYTKAKAGQRIDLVVKQITARGTASAGDKEIIVLPQELRGVVPNVVGLPLGRARAKLAKAKLQVQTKGAARGKVVAQSIHPRTASAPGQRIVLTVKGTGG